MLKSNIKKTREGKILNVVLYLEMKISIIWLFRNYISCCKILAVVENVVPGDYEVKYTLECKKNIPSNGITWRCISKINTLIKLNFKGPYFLCTLFVYKTIIFSFAYRVDKKTGCEWNVKKIFKSLFFTGKHLLEKNKRTIRSWLRNSTREYVFSAVTLSIGVFIHSLKSWQRQQSNAECDSASTRSRKHDHVLHATISNSICKHEFPVTPRVFK